MRTTDGGLLRHGIHNRRLHVSLARQIAIEILSGRMPEGHLFPGEIEHSERLGISRSALREAFRILSAKGLIESRPRAGTRVTEKRRWTILDPDLLAWQFEAEPKPVFVRDLFELRMAIEPAAAALAASRRSDDDINQMAGALDAIAKQGLATEAGRAADQTFHRVMMEATRNDAIIALSSSIMAAVAWTTVFKQRRGTLPRDPMPEHRALFAAIADGDPECARSAMARLVELALRDTETSPVE